MSRSPDDRKSGLPVPGDVLVAKDLAGGTGYNLSTVPNPPQLHYATHEGAVAQAIKWARREGVAVWFTEDGKTFALLGLKSGSTPSEAARLLQPE
jgi:hypothetical protein